MPAPHIDRIDPSKLRESAYSVLRDAFVRGQFSPGDSLNLRTLADQLGTSMTPVREAVRRLVAEGALMDTPSRTLIVPPFNVQRMADLKAARLSLEGLVLERAMDCMTPEFVDTLQVMLDEAKRDRDEGADLDVNYRFHFTIYGLSQSSVLIPLIEALWLQYGAFLNVSAGHQHARDVDEHELHYKMIDAFRAGDREAARAALETDIVRIFDYIASKVGEKS